jgi:hypothetical protein
VQLFAALSCQHSSHFSICFYFVLKSFQLVIGEDVIAPGSLGRFLDACCRADLADVLFNRPAKELFYQRPQAVRADRCHPCLLIDLRHAVDRCGGILSRRGGLYLIVQGGAPAQQRSGLPLDVAGRMPSPIKAGRFASDSCRYFLLAGGSLPARSCAFMSNTAARGSPRTRQS